MSRSKSQFSLRSGVLLVTVAALSVLSFKALKPQNQLLAAPQMNLIRAPEFPASADWLNTDKPLSMRGLKGKIVLLDFWTYACINCMHILPDLKKLERKYPNELVVIGVHSAKFENERESQNIRNAILRYKIEHPVLNDKTMRVWDEYAIKAWPSLVLVDPNGRIANQLAGEGHLQTLDTQIAAMIKEFKARGELKSGPMQFALEAAKVAKTDLSFPGKILASGNTLFTADSNHNRVIVSDLKGNVQTVFGSGAQGFDDGDSNQSSFHNPQGMALSVDGSTLFVADTDNHAIRALNLKTKKVTTIAGTGKQAEYRKWGGTGTGAALASPWDVLRVGSTLYVAMAGTHQVWAMDLKSQKIAPYAGSGAEARLDANLKQSALAQPSGLATDGKNLFFADSESSSIRTISLPGNGDEVKTLVGGDPNPRNLFAFGDKDGKGFNAKLQHPLGVAFDNGKVFVADTYNHKLKTLDAQSGQIETLELDTKFSEPGGISFSDEKLFVADTNNHQVRVVDLKTKTVANFKFVNLPVPSLAEPQRAVATVKPGVLQAPTAIIAPNSKGELVFDVKLPAGFKLNKDAPQGFDAKVVGANLKVSKTQIRKPQFSLPLRVPIVAGNAGSGVLQISATVNYCDEVGTVCKVARWTMEAPFQIQNGGANVLKVGARIDADNAVSISAMPTESTKKELVKIMKTDEEWKAELSPEQYQVMRKKGTERAFTGALLKNDKSGVYKCAGCDAELFASDTKFDSGTGWPSFYKPVNDVNVAEETDVSYGMKRVEVLCAKCDAHLGHVFDDGPNPTGLRYCINSASLEFEEKK